jgi:hypothetical protein
LKKQNEDAYNDDFKPMLQRKVKLLETEATALEENAV